MLFRR
jgi:WD40 repeat protein